MEKKELLITHHGRTVHGYFFKPKATRKFPLVIISHGYNGYKDDFEKTAEYLADAGIASVCIYIFVEEVHEMNQAFQQRR